MLLSYCAGDGSLLLFSILHIFCCKAKFFNQSGKHLHDSPLSLGREIQGISSVSSRFLIPCLQLALQLLTVQQLNSARVVLTDPTLSKSQCQGLIAQRGNLNTTRRGHPAGLSMTAQEELRFSTALTLQEASVRPFPHSHSNQKYLYA